jgi:hypothetical protein
MRKAVECRSQRVLAQLVPRAFHRSSCFPEFYFIFLLQSLQRAHGAPRNRCLYGKDLHGKDYCAACIELNKDFAT